MKLCKRCGEIKEFSDFSKDSYKSSGLRTLCKVCDRQRQRDYYVSSHPEARKNKQYYYGTVYRYKNHNITLEQFSEMLQIQNNACAGCLTLFTDSKEDWNSSACIDHDHKCCPGIRGCGKCVRGLLCQRCNKAAGCAVDNPDTLRRLADYLEKGVF